MRRINFILAMGLLGLATIACNPKPKKFTPAQNKTFNENLVKANKGLVDKDQLQIASAIEQNGWKMNKTATGLWYEIIKQGSGELVKSGQYVQLKYEIKFLNGTVCYTSDSLGLKIFKVGQGGVESGLEEGVLLLNEGAAARFILPPYLAYGLLGDNDKIPPRSTIIYNVELLKLTNQ